MHKGSCLCGAVRFEVAGDLPPPNACHCSICRKQSGHFGASTDVPREDFTLWGEANLRWYDSSAKARRGFCGTCGTPLFFAPLTGDWIAIAMGAFDAPTDTRLALHIYVANKGDYYEIADGLPQNPQ